MNKNEFDKPGSLMQKTITLIREDQRSLLELYSETGIPFYWLRKFVNNEFKNPSVNRVQYLYEFLSNSKIG